MTRRRSEIVLDRDLFENLVEDLREVLLLVDEQAEDPALWAERFPLPSIVEAYIQRELRRLHEKIEAVRVSPYITSPYT